MKAPLPISALPRAAAPLVLAVVVLALAACGGDTLNRTRPLPPTPFSASLANFRDADLGEATAFQVSGASPVRPSQTSDWDFVFWVTDGGEPQFRPWSTIVGGDSQAGLQRVESSFNGLTEAPQGGYRTSEPVSADSGAVFAVRSRQDPSIGAPCRRFAKLQVTSVNPEAGTVTFDHLVNPNCERRNLQPGTRGQDNR